MIGFSGAHSSTPITISLSDAKPYPDLWLPDGNTIIYIISANETEEPLRKAQVKFRLYRGLLCSQSTFFHDLFTLSPLSTSNEPVMRMDVEDGCPIVVLYDDDPEEAVHFFKALIDSRYFGPPPSVIPRSFKAVVGVLHLSTKYNVPHLRRRAIRHIEWFLPANFKEFRKSFGVFLDLAGVGIGLNRRNAEEQLRGEEEQQDTMYRRGEGMDAKESARAHRVEQLLRYLDVTGLAADDIADALQSAGSTSEDDPTSTNRRKTSFLWASPMLLKAVIVSDVPWLVPALMLMTVLQGMMYFYADKTMEKLRRHEDRLRENQDEIRLSDPSDWFRGEPILSTMPGLHQPFQELWVYLSSESSAIISLCDYLTREGWEGYDAYETDSSEESPTAYDMQEDENSEGGDDENEEDEAMDGAEDGFAAEEGGQEDPQIDNGEPQIAGLAGVEEDRKSQLIERGWTCVHPTACKRFWRTKFSQLPSSVRQQDNVRPHNDTITKSIDENLQVLETSEFENHNMNLRAWVEGKPIHGSHGVSRALLVLHGLNMHSSYWSWDTLPPNLNPFPPSSPSTESESKGTSVPQSPSQSSSPLLIKTKTLSPFLPCPRCKHDIKIRLTKVYKRLWEKIPIICRTKEWTTLWLIRTKEMVMPAAFATVRGLGGKKKGEVVGLSREDGDIRGERDTPIRNIEPPLQVTSEKSLYAKSAPTLATQYRPYPPKPISKHDGGSSHPGNLHTPRHTPVDSFTALKPLDSLDEYRTSRPPKLRVCNSQVYRSGFEWVWDEGDSTGVLWIWKMQMNIDGDVYPVRMKWEGENYDQDEGADFILQNSEQEGGELGDAQDGEGDDEESSEGEDADDEPRQGVHRDWLCRKRKKHLWLPWQNHVDYYGANEKNKIKDVKWKSGKELEERDERKWTLEEHRIKVLLGQNALLYRNLSGQSDEEDQYRKTGGEGGALDEMDVEWAIDEGNYDDWTKNSFFRAL